MTRLRRALLIALVPGLLAIPAWGGEALRRVTVPPGAEVVVAPRGQAAPPPPPPPRQAAPAAGPALPRLAPDRAASAGPGLGSGAFGLAAPFPALLPLAAAALVAGGSALPGGGGGGGAPAGTR